MLKNSRGLIVILNTLVKTCLTELVIPQPTLQGHKVKDNDIWEMIFPSRVSSQSNVQKTFWGVARGQHGRSRVKVREN